MNTLKIYPDKRLQFVEENSIYITENKIQSFNIILPLTFGDYRTNELECEMRVYLSDDEYMSYEVSTATGKGEVPITNDITEKVQTVKIVFFFTKDGNVIGKTNVVEKKIEDAPYLGDPLTPRAEFDEVISEQRQTIQEQSETITQQGETITQQSSQITELNGEVTELTTENTRLENLTETQRQTIQYTIDHPPQPKLYTPPVVTPSGSVQQINPPTGYDGLSNAVVDRVSAEGVGFNPDYYKEGETCLGEVGTYDPFPYNSVGGIYITEVDEDGYPVKVIAQNITKPKIPFVYPLNNDSFSKLALKSFKFENCLQITTLANSCFVDSSVLKEVQLPEALVALPQFCFDGCSSLKEIDIPYTVKRIENYALRYTAIEEIIIPHGVEHLGAQLFNSRALKTVSLPNTLTQIEALAWYLCYGLQNVTLENGFNCNNLNLSSSTLYSHDTILSWFDALADRSGDTAYTLTIGATNIAKMTAEEIAIATNKNWNLA